MENKTEERIKELEEDVERLKRKVFRTISVETRGDPIVRIKEE